MKDPFPKLTFPFVYLDSSFLCRGNNSAAQKLTRKLLSHNPQRFHSLLDELITASKADYSYYEKIIHLQHRNIISALVTFEALNPNLVTESPNLISLFGNINIVPAINNACYAFGEDLVLWGENVKTKTYIAAAMTILNSSCIVAEDAFLSLSVGRSLTQYITSNSVFCVLKSNDGPKNIGDNSVVYELSPKKFIQILCSQL